MKPPVSIVLVFNPDFTHVLMLKRIKNEFGFDWGYVTGKTEENETPHQTALREMKEEIGVEQTPVHILPLTEFGISVNPATFSTFVTTIPMDTLLELAHDEISETKWFSIHQLPESRPKGEDSVIQEIVAFIQPFLLRPYRPNVQFWCFRNDGKLLLLDESDDKEVYWKFPQGGIEAGETNEEAIKRELKEEIHVETFQIRAKVAYVNRYNWPPSLLQTKNYRGQEQHIYLVYLPKPDEVKPNHEEGIKNAQWMTIEEAINQFRIPNQKLTARKVWKEFGLIIEQNQLNG